jgi:Fuc2NAc and GlcNAc transferase
VFYVNANLLMQSTLLAGAAMASGFALGFPVHWALVRWNIVDRPNERSSHSHPTARGGGIAVLMAFVLLSAFAVDVTWNVALIVLAGLMLAVVSFVDDLKSLPQLLRFGAHTGAALVALYALYPGRTVVHSRGIVAGVTTIGFLWITGYTNAFNFMDGINGIAAMQIVTTGIGTALIGFAAGGTLDHPAITLSLVLAGAGAGFLPHNFPRARMFLGDVGSVPIGFYLAVLAFWLARDFGWWLLCAFGLIHGNFVVDTAVTLARRIWRGERWFEPHRDHFYQRLVRTGKSHQFVTGWESIIQVVVLFVVVVAVRRGWTVRFVATGIVCVLWITVFGYAEFKSRRCLNPRNSE